MFDQMKTDAMRTLYDVFPDKTVKWGQFIASAVEWLDAIYDKKFGLNAIRKNTILEYAHKNWLPIRDLSQAQKALAPRMRKITKITTQ